MRRYRARLPTPDELASAPELAILGSLEATIDLTIVALVAAHPELQASDDRQDVVTSASALGADDVIAQAQSLAIAIDRYRAARRHD